MPLETGEYKGVNKYTGLPFPIKPGDCLSTHGGAGYCIGDYFDGDKIVCCLCGAVLNPRKEAIGPHVLGSGTRQNKYRCLQCGKEFPKALRIPVWYKGKITAYKCPYCRGKIQKVEDKQ